MAVSKKSVKVVQYNNPKRKGPEDPEEWVYEVKSLNNLTRPSVGSWLSEKQIEQLIRERIDVRISSSK